MFRSWSGPGVAERMLGDPSGLSGVCPLRLEDVSYSIAGLDLLAGVNLELARGESVAVMGSSGCGKSTLLSIAIGLITPTGGHVRVADTDMNKGSAKSLARHRRDQIGVVFQAGELLNELTAVENVELPALLAGLKPVDARRRADELLDQVGLKDRAGTHAEVLSGGERQRVAVARALVNDPALILADEPTGSLDESVRDAVADLLFALPSLNACALLVVTHDRRVAARADRSFSLEGGLLQPCGVSQ